MSKKSYKNRKVINHSLLFPRTYLLKSVIYKDRKKQMKYLRKSRKGQKIKNTLAVQKFRHLKSTELSTCS